LNNCPALTALALTKGRKNMKTLKLGLSMAAILGLLSSSVCAQAPKGAVNQAVSGTAGATNPGADVATADRDFIKEAAQVNLKEIALGELAKQKTHSEGIRSFAQRMIDDHRAAEASLSIVARKMGVTVPGELNKQGQAACGHLQKLSDEQFDKAYIDAMVEGHTKVASKMKRMAMRLQNVDLQDWNTTTLRTVLTHLQLAQKEERAVDRAVAQSGQSAAKQTNGAHY
jgi:putative membrane protein